MLGVCTLKEEPLFVSRLSSHQNPAIQDYSFVAFAVCCVFRRELVRRASLPPPESEGPITGLPAGFSRSLCILGSTGSIGTQALQVVREYPQAFNVRVLAATGARLKPLVEQALEFT